MTDDGMNFQTGSNTESVDWADERSRNVGEININKRFEKSIGFWDLMAIATGAIIGSGIMSLTGIGIGRTGRSIFVAFIIGGFITLLARSPQIFLNSVARFRGGDYSMVGTLLGPRWTGTYSMISLLTSVTLSMYALSFYRLCNAVSSMDHKGRPLRSEY